MKRKSGLHLLFYVFIGVLAEPLINRNLWQPDSAAGNELVRANFIPAPDKRKHIAAVLTGSKLNEVQCGDTSIVNVTCPPYNAVPNNNQDVANAFQAAVDAVRPGGKIFIPAGTYLFKSPLVIHKSVDIVGAGPATILIHNATLSTNGESNFIRIGGAAGVTRAVTIRSVTLQGPERSELRTSMIRIANNVKGVRIRDVFFKNVSSTCILIYGNNVQNVEITNNRADEFYEQFVELARGGIANVRIAGNIAQSTRGHPKLRSTKPYGVMLESKMSGEIKDVTINNNRFSFDGMDRTEMINTGGVFLGFGDPATSYLYHGISVENNTIRRVGVGIRVQTLRSGNVSGPGSIIIRGNRIEDVQSDGIQVSPAGDSTYQDTISITGNIVAGYSAQAYNRYDGIHVLGRGMNVDIERNDILPVAGRKDGYGRYGINIEAGVQKVVIRDNKIDGYMSGAILNGETSDKAKSK